jgi:hypothetical protein
MTGRRRRPPLHDHRQSELPGCDNLGVGRLAPTRLGDQHLDAVLPQQSELPADAATTAIEAILSNGVRSRALRLR